MKKAILSIAILNIIIFNLSAQTGNKALLIIDIQDFYFPGGSQHLLNRKKLQPMPLSY